MRLKGVCKIFFKVMHASFTASLFQTMIFFYTQTVYCGFKGKEQHLGDVTVQHDMSLKIHFKARSCFYELHTCMQESVNQKYIQKVNQLLQYKLVVYFQEFSSFVSVYLNFSQLMRTILSFKHILQFTFKQTQLIPKLIIFYFCQVKKS